MRALLSTIGSRGDVQPLVALALALRELGQDVRLCVPPDFREWIEGLGFAVTPIGPELRTFTASRPASAGPPLPMTAEQRRQLVDASVATQFTTVAEAAEGCDAIVAATALQIAARSVAELRGIPYVFAAYCPIVFPSPHHAPPPLPPIPGQPPDATPPDNETLWARDAQRFRDLFGPALNAHRASIGLAPVDDVRSHVFGQRPWLAADPVLAPWPDPNEGSVIQAGAWIVQDERPLATDVEAFLDAGDPPIYFGFGSIRIAPDLGAVMLETARALGRRAIVSRGWADLTLDAAPDCLAIGEANLHRLFPRVAAVVHHGGAGTTTIAARAGASQVIVPQMYDQHYFARRVQDLGIGVAHAAGVPTAASLTEALEAALVREVAVQARTVASTILSNGAHAAAERVRDIRDRR
jgi:vancomycin aglycone glucosyltransferase